MEISIKIICSKELTKVIIKSYSKKKGKKVFKIKNKVINVQSSFPELQNAICHKKTDGTIEIIQNDAKIPNNPIMTFNELIKGPFSEQILHAINDFGYHQPTKIQNEAIPILIDKRQDLISQSYSYTGKKIAILISMMLRINKDIHLPQAICFNLANSQAIHFFEVFTKLNTYTNIKGGVCIKYADPPSKDSQILFGTPRSILHYVEKNIIDVSNVNLLIINDTNMILDPFLDNYEAATTLIKIFPKTVQYGFFSRDLPNSVLKFVKKMRPNIVSIFTSKSECEDVEHWYTKASNIEEAEMIMFDLVRMDSNCKTIIFTLSEDITKSISDFLIQKGVSCAAYYLDLDRENKNRILNSFRKNEFKVLVISDIINGGLYFSEKDMVINYQVPTEIKFPPRPRKYRFDEEYEEEKIEVADCSSFKRRSTKVGHYGKKGVCFTILTSKKDEENLYEICSEQKLNIPLKYIDKDQFELI